MTRDKLKQRTDKCVQANFEREKDKVWEAIWGASNRGKYSVSVPALSPPVKSWYIENGFSVEYRLPGSSEYGYTISWD